MNAQQLIISVGGAEQIQCTLAEFLMAYADALSGAEIDALMAALARGETFQGGGGAAPEFEIRAA